MISRHSTTQPRLPSRPLPRPKHRSPIMRALVINPRLRLPQTPPRRPKTHRYPLPHASTALPSRATSVIASATCAHWTPVTVDRALKSRTWSGRAVRQMTWDESSAFGFPRPSSRQLGLSRPSSRAVEPVARYSSRNDASWHALGASTIERNSGETVPWSSVHNEVLQIGLHNGFDDLWHWCERSQHSQNSQDKLKEFFD